MAKKEKKEEKRKIHFKRNFKEYFSIVALHKWTFIALILSVIITESLFIADKFLYKWLIDDAEGFVANVITQSAFLTTATLILAFYLGIVIARSFGNWFNGHILAILKPKMMMDLKEKYFSHIMTLSHKFHSEHKTGSLISRLNRGTSAIEGMTDIFAFQAGPLIVQLIMVFISIAIFTIKPAIALVLITLAFVFYSVYWQNKQKKTQVAFNESKDRESGYIADVLTNIESVKYFGEEMRIDKKYQKLSDKTRKLLSKYWDYFSIMGLGQFLIIGLGLVALIYFPLMEFINGTMSLGTVVFIYSLYGNVAGNLFRFVWGIRTFYRSMGDMEDLFQYKEYENEIKDKPNAKKLNIQKGSIELDNVTFGYEKKKKILKNFSLDIKPNEKVALVGHSGSGKTTIVKLLNRLYDVNKGSIKIDGNDLRDVKQQSLRSETGIVPQEAILFDDTIYNNIKFSKPNATRKEVLKAIKFAQLDKIIAGFPKKENTIVGERGVKLSGGEKQRVSIARAILADRKVLILDEATSALDSRTENEIQKALQKLLKGRTSIIIAHRLSTIMNADRIIVMKKGRIVEEGNHNELIKKGGEYSSLWDLQKGGYLSE